MVRLLQFTSVFMFRLEAELLGSMHDRLSDANFSLYAELENDILEFITRQINEMFEGAGVVATQGLEVARAKVEEAQKARENALSDAERKVDDAGKEWQSYERRVRSTSQPIIDHHLSEVSRLRSEVDSARKDFNGAVRTAERAVERANQDRAAALARARRDIENAKKDVDRAINDAQRQLYCAQSDLFQSFGNAQQAIDRAQRDVLKLENEINDVKRTIYDCEHAPWVKFWKKSAIPGLWGAARKLDASKDFTSGVLDAAHSIMKGTEYITKVAAVESARVALEGARETGKVSLSAAQEKLMIVDEASDRGVNRAKNNLEGVRAGTEFVAFQAATEALGQFQNGNKVAYETAVGAVDGLMESSAFIAFNSAKAGLEVAKESTQLLDATKESLALVQTATQTTFSTLQEVTGSGAHIVNIKAIVVSGTLRGILSVDSDGGNARPLSAVIKGYLAGNWFDIRGEFDPSKPIGFINAIFKQ